MPYDIKIEKSINIEGYDGILFVSPGKAGDDGPEPLPSIIAKAIKVIITTNFIIPAIYFENSYEYFKLVFDFYSLIKQSNAMVLFWKCHYRPKD